MRISPQEGDECICGDGYLVEHGNWHICCACGGAVTHSGKYLPPKSGWDIPVLTDQERSAAADRLDHAEVERNFWRDAFSEVR